MDEITKRIQVLRNIEFTVDPTAEKAIEITQIFDGEFRKLIEITLINGGILKKHKSAEPITVLCLAGNGIFYAGDDLDEEVEIVPGTLLTLDADILHEVAAKPNIKILVTKFKID